MRTRSTLSSRLWTGRLSGGEAGGIPTGIDGLNALLIAEAALESANSGRLVTIES